MTPTITLEDLHNTKNRIFFVLGTSRSGSTLLQSMLSSHSELIVPPETHFFNSYQHLQKEFKSTNRRTDFRERVIDFWYDQKTRIRDLNLQKEEVLKLAENLNLANPLELFTLQLTMYRVERDKLIIGEKTPRHMLHVSDILDAYPGAKIISLFRDPRAKAYSEIKAQFGSPSVLVSTKRWKKYVRVHEQLQQELDKKQYLMIRYSDLIADAEGVLQKICDFLGVSFEKQMLNYYDRDETGFADGETSWKKRTLKPIQKNRNEDWKSALTNWQIALIENTAGDYLKKMNFKTSNVKSLPFPIKLLWKAVDYSRSARAAITRSRQEGYIDPHTFKF
ncbi:MAG: sulfotransferase [Balneolaceae bacterium]|nr:sulfotransferase [Balneolaceae bacterium]